MADIKFKKIIKKYGGLILALMIILIVIGFYPFKSSETELENQDLTPSSSNQSVPQFPVLFTSEGKLEAKIIHNKPSMYGQIVVYDYVDNVRTLMLDGTILCTWNFKNQVATSHIHEIANVLKENLKDKKDILLVGLGCGGVLKEIAGQELNIDVVEINPNIVEAAERYFVLPKNLNYKIFLDDGLHFLRNQEKKYDVIVIDLCDILETNAHLYTEEFYELANSKLKNQNSFLIQSLNIYRKGDIHQLDHKVANSILRHFQYLYITNRTVGEQGFDVLNFFATNQESETDDIPFISWEVDINQGSINQDNVFQMIQYHLPVINELRKQAIRNFGFDIRLK